MVEMVIDLPVPGQPTQYKLPPIFFFKRLTNMRAQGDGDSDGDGDGDSVQTYERFNNLLLSLPTWDVIDNRWRSL